MVNASIVIPLSLLAISASIVIFVRMQTINLDTEDISFIDACYGRHGDKDEGCAMFATEDIDWDTKILCHEHDDNSGTYTMRGSFNAIDRAKEAHTVNGELDMDAATASYFEWFDDECGKGQSLPEGAVDASLTMTKEEWDALPDAEGPDTEDWNIMPDKSSAGRRLSHSGYNFEQICSTDPQFLAGGGDSAECSGLHNRDWLTNAKNEKFPPTTPRCDAFLGNKKYYETKTTLGIACLNHDACLQKGGRGKPGGCNDDCSECNPGYQSNLPGGWDCDKTLHFLAAECGLFGHCNGSDWREALAVSKAMRTYAMSVLDCKVDWWRSRCWWRTHWFLSSNYLTCHSDCALSPKGCSSME